MVNVIIIGNDRIIVNDPIIVNLSFNYLSCLNLLEKKKELVIFKMNKCYSRRTEANLLLLPIIRDKKDDNVGLYWDLKIQFIFHNFHKIILFNCS